MRWRRRSRSTPRKSRQLRRRTSRQYTTPEQRQAAHILITVKPDAKEDDKAAAKKKAEALFAQAKANPAKFADLAKANSQDPGLGGSRAATSASFARGSMVKPFEDAVFAAKSGDIVGPVQTRFRLSRDQGDRRDAVARRRRSTKSRRRSKRI